MPVLRVLFALICAAVTLAHPFSKAPNVTLDDGTIVIGASHLRDFVSYRGIRYGEVPERFAASQRWHPKPGSVIDGSGSDSTTSCWQMAEAMGTRYVPSGSEDCLFLDVNVPSMPESGGSAVMFWIHGGGLVAGKKSIYETGLPTFVLEGNVVTVAINYRLDIMGFFAGPGVPTNNGIRDQILALQWNKANIANFGGNPDRVTIFGESAGGLSTTVLAFSPLASGLFQRAIAQSPMWQDAAQFQRPMADAQTSLTAQCMTLVGCDSVDCMRNKPAEAFLQCNMQNGGAFIGKEGQYFTGFDGDVLPRPLYKMMCSGETNNVDIIVGGLPHEWRYFQHQHLSLSQVNVTALNPGFPDPMEGQFPLEGAIKKFLTEYVTGYSQSAAHVQRCVMQKVMEHYEDAPKYNTCPGCTEFNSSSMVKMMQAATDIEGTLGAQLLAQSSGGLRYRYLFDNEGDGSPRGAEHAEDVAYFCELPGVCDFTLVNTRQKIGLGQTLRKLWTSFAKNGAPDGGDSTWPQVDRKVGLGVPLLHMRLNGTSVRHSAWFNNDAAELLAGIACGKMDIDKLGCHSLVGSEPAIAI